MPTLPPLSWLAPTAAHRDATVVRPLSEAARSLLQGDESHWAGRRAPPSSADVAVGRAGRLWLAALPPSCWPGELARTFPRLVNQLALAWPDRVLCERTFERLLGDERGGRRGFPPAVRAELLALQRLRRDTERPAAPRPLALVDAGHAAARR